MSPAGRSSPAQPSPAQPPPGLPPGGTLVVRLDNAGDVLLAGPAVRAVAGGSGAGPVRLLCGPRGRAAAELLPGVDEVLEWRAPWIDAEPPPVDRAATEALVAAVAGRGVERAVLLGSSHQSPLPLALLLRLAGVGHLTAVSHEYPGSLLDVRLRGDPDVHEVERNLRVAEAAGFPRPPDDRLRVDLGAPRPARDGDPAADPGRHHAPHTSGRPAPVVVVHPGASVPARTLAPERWRAVVKALVDDGWRVRVVGSPEEAVLTAGVAGEDAGVQNLGGATTLRELGSVIAEADVLVGGNSGPVHLAAAVGTPCVTAFAPTVPLRRWHPWRVPYVALGDQDVACAGCRARRCPLPRQACLDVVGPDDVVQAARSLLPRDLQPTRAPQPMTRTATIPSPEASR